jgi:acyl carrier protein
LPKCRFVNIYGSSEVTADATFHVLEGSADRSVSIGRPIANTQVYVLDAHMQPVPPGVAGEIYVGGAGVARGYLKRPSLTAERFIADPFSQASSARMYKTGDVGRWRADGTLEYLSRNDDQVKIRGYRIELGEIEWQLSGCAGVKQAAVVARGESSEKRLVAYVCGEALDAQQLRAQLKDVLPEYMVPSAYVVLDQLPLTPNGKVDRRALPAPDYGALIVQRYEEPQGEVEAQLAQIWQKIIGVPRVGRHDNFFELGGHSLLAVQVVRHISTAFAVELQLIALFEAPTISELANQVQRRQEMELEIALTGEQSESTQQLLEKVARLSQEDVASLLQEMRSGARDVG